MTLISRGGWNKEAPRLGCSGRKCRKVFSVVVMKEL